MASEEEGKELEELQSGVLYTGLAAELPGSSEFRVTMVSQRMVLSHQGVAVAW